MLFVVVLTFIRLFVIIGSSAVQTVDQQVNDDGVAICSSSRHRRKHWLADDGCNECKCTKPVTDDIDDKEVTSTPILSCTNLWCGPASNDCLSSVVPCTGTNQVTCTNNDHSINFFFCEKLILIDFMCCVQICIPVVDVMDDEELLDDDFDKRSDGDGSVSTVDSLNLWRQCLRPPCGGVGTSGGADSDRDREDVRLRYGYDDDDDDADDDSAYVAVSSWVRRRRRGQCVTTVPDDDDVDGPIKTVWPLSVRHCLPNGIGSDKHISHAQHRRHRDDACGRLRITLDPARLRRGTRISAVCHSLRRLLARTWVRDDDEELTQEEEDDRRNQVYVMCEAAATEDQRVDDERSGGSVGGRRRRRRRRVTIRVSVVRNLCYLIIIPPSHVIIEDFAHLVFANVFVFSYEILKCY